MARTCVRSSAPIRGSPRKARETVDEATLSRWAISTIRTVWICFRGIFFGSSERLAREDWLAIYSAAQRYAQQTAAGKPHVVSTAVVQINDYGEYAINSWVITND